MSQPFSHLVTVDVEKRCLRVVRVMPNGEHVLFTELPLAPTNGQGWTEEVTALAHTFGEDLLMVSSGVGYGLGLDRSLASSDVGQAGRGE